MTMKVFCFLIFASFVIGATFEEKRANDTNEVIALADDHLRVQNVEN